MKNHSVYCLALQRESSKWTLKEVIKSAINPDYICEIKYTVK